MAHPSHHHKDLRISTDPSSSQVVDGLVMYGDCCAGFLSEAGASRSGVAGRCRSQTTCSLHQPSTAPFTQVLEPRLRTVRRNRQTHSAFAWMSICIRRSSLLQSRSPPATRKGMCTAATIMSTGCICDHLIYALNFTTYGVPSPDDQSETRLGHQPCLDLGAEPRSA